MVRAVRYGLARVQRIRRRREFEELLGGGRRHAEAGFVFYYRRRDAGPARLGIVISRRHARKATGRNALRRRIREAFRLEQHALGPIDVLVRPPLGARPRADLTSRLRELLRRIPR